jgi:hypothetical protein
MGSERKVHVMTSRDSFGPWLKSSYSSANGDCVEVASCVGDGRAVRDSKVSSGPMLSFPAAGWSAFLAVARDGAFGV